MHFPSPEVAQAVEATKEFKDWITQNQFPTFEQAWLQCPIGEAMFKVLMTLNPDLKPLQWVAFKAALRAVQAENMDLDERLLDHLAQRKASLTSGDDNYDSEAALARAISLNRITANEVNPNRAKSMTMMAIGWACCRNLRSCGMALESAVHAERFRHQADPDPEVYPRLEASHQADDIRDLFKTPVAISRFQVPSRYQRRWVI